MSREKLGIILFLILITWTGVIFYFSSQPPALSNHQSKTVIRIIQKVNDFFDITDTKFYAKAADLLKDTQFFKRYKTPNAMIRKTAHFGTYFLLGVISSAFGYVYSRKLFMGFLLGASLPVMIAVIDEVNQGFVGRTSLLDDVVIDGMGALAGDLVFVFIILFIKAIMLGKHHFLAR